MALFAYNILIIGDGHAEGLTRYILHGRRYTHLRDEEVYNRRMTLLQLIEYVNAIKELPDRVMISIGNYDLFLGVAANIFRNRLVMLIHWLRFYNVQEVYILPLIRYPGMNQNLFQEYTEILESEWVDDAGFSRTLHPVDVFNVQADNDTVSVDADGPFYSLLYYDGPARRIRSQYVPVPISAMKRDPTLTQPPIENIPDIVYNHLRMDEDHRAGNPQPRANETPGGTTDDEAGPLPHQLSNFPSTAGFSAQRLPDMHGPLYPNLPEPMNTSPIEQPATPGQSMECDTNSPARVESMETTEQPLQQQNTSNTPDVFVVNADQMAEITAREREREMREKARSQDSDDEWRKKQKEARRIKNEQDAIEQARERDLEDRVEREIQIALAKNPNGDENQLRFHFRSMLRDADRRQQEENVRKSRSRTRTPAAARQKCQTARMHTTPLARPVQPQLFTPPDVATLIPPKPTRRSSSQRQSPSRLEQFISPTISVSESNPPVTELLQQPVMTSLDRRIEEMRQNGDPLAQVSEIDTSAGLNSTDIAITDYSDPARTVPDSWEDEIAKGDLINQPGDGGTSQTIAGVTLTVIPRKVARLNSEDEREASDKENQSTTESEEDDALEK
ncbi:uncharacterized protein LOC135837666 [Planococcus citri]|uniref:uncharacterized protein LOC135837666 n=1 Tax=Planococcus citri TaxID=170843 RepID=UPI0031F9753C